MINIITIKGPASYKEKAVLETQQNVNLIYGLNGAGKSTFSEFLRNYKDERYKECSIEPKINDEEEEILVYNEHYVDEVFYESTKQKGIFSLSKENNAAKKIIDIAKEKRLKISENILKEQQSFSIIQQEWGKQYNGYVERVWGVQREYSGGDRVLDYCLTGYKRSKEVLFSYLSSLPKPLVKPDYTIDMLKNQVRLLEAAAATPIERLSEVISQVTEIENDSIFQDVITGNKDSYVAALINELQNSDWVKEGLFFQSNDVCPFCQRPYDDGANIDDLTAFFDKSYESAINKLRDLYAKYAEFDKALLPNAAFDSIEIIQDLKHEYQQAYSNYVGAIRENLKRIANKIKTPSSVMTLLPTDEILQKLNGVIHKANERIFLFNEKVRNKKIELDKIKSLFWKYIRYEYDQTILDYTIGYKDIENKRKQHNAAVDRLREQLEEQNRVIAEQQMNVINIEDSIQRINSLLQNIGIDNIIIRKVDDEEMYTIARGEEQEITFKTLSEGERTIISVLYFIETCKGLIDKGSFYKKRIVVFDDPISSLSTQYLFAIGRIISDTFYPNIKKNHETGQLDVEPKIEQLFILTHSLYFFYEMTAMKKEHRDVSQKLFRIFKSSTGSQIEQMHYEHIQSDYHSYWMAIKDRTTPVLWANCMRNIIEYFFYFVEKRDLNNVFQKLTDSKYQAFKRFINRESHSLGQNIYDFKEFNYEVFLEAFKLVFYENGYQKHFDKMMKIG